MRRLLRDRRYEVAGVGVALILLAWLYWFAGWVMADRPALVSTPSPPPFGKPFELPLAAGSEACLDSLALTPHTQVAQIRVFTKGRPAQPLRITVRPEGGRETTSTLTRYLDGQEAAVPIQAPDREVFGTLCVENTGTRGVFLSGSQETKTLARGITKVDGEEAPADFTLQFFEQGSKSVADRFSFMVDRVAMWKPGGPWLIWLIGVVVLIALPAGTIYAFASSVRDDDP